MTKPTAPTGQRNSALARPALKGQVVSQRFQDLDATIKRGGHAFVEMGDALTVVRDDRLYKEAGYSSFEACCRQRWQLSKSYATRLIVAARTVHQLGEVVPIGTILKLVMNEHQARAIGSRMPFIKHRVEGGQAPEDAIRAELEDRQQSQQRPAATSFHRQRVQERQELTLKSWKVRLSALLLDLEELPEPDREAAVAELREEVAALD